MQQDNYANGNTFQPPQPQSVGYTPAVLSRGKVGLKQCFMIYTGRENPQFIRPYESALHDSNTLNQYHEYKSGHYKVTPGLMAGLANDIIRPSANVQGMANIDNGWDIARLRFFMRFDIGGNSGVHLEQVISGFTDHYGVDSMGNFDPNMKVYFNSSVLLTTRINIEPGGARNPVTIVGNSQQIVPPIPPSPLILPSANVTLDTYGQTAAPQPKQWSQPTNNKYTLLTPASVVGNMNSVDITDNYENRGGVVDFRNTLYPNSQRLMDRNDSYSPNYLSRTLSSLERVLGDPNAADTFDTHHSPYEVARSDIADPSMSQNRFLSFIKDNTSYVTKGYVTWSELARLFPNINDDSTTRVVKPKTDGFTVGAIPVDTAGQGNNFGGANNEDIIANTVITALPALMANRMLTRVGINITNATVTGVPNVFISNVNSFIQGVDLHPYIASLEQEVIQTLLPLITFNGQCEVIVSAQIDIFNRSFVSVNFENGGNVDYFVPNYCDASYSPMLANDSVTIDKLSKTFQDLTSTPSFGNDTFNPTWR